MQEGAPLAKTVRINQLFDVYRHLLTDKQRTFLMHYYQEDYSLGEIAEGFAISRQAVYEHIKRAEHALEDYEDKLQILRKQEARKALLDRLLGEADKVPGDQGRAMAALLRELQQLDGHAGSGTSPADE